ncbi:MAG: hypothetical protein QOH62_3485 [Solirubrobacteraceae bacterium]|jgi:hypothetical protein|nr:hypothetical protein [Solirubrobacteraceae bacterium]
MILRAVPVLAAVLLVLPAAAQAAGPWFVAKGGSNANTCLDAAHACLTINGAVGKASNGNTINIGAGTFKEVVAPGSKVLAFVGAGSGAGGTIVDAVGVGSHAFSLPQAGTLSHLRAVCESGATLDVGATVGGRALVLNDVVVNATGLQSPIDALPTGAGSLQITVSDSMLRQSGASDAGSPQGAELGGNITATFTRSTVTATVDDAIRARDGAHVSVTDSTVAGTTGIRSLDGTVTILRSTIVGNADRALSIIGDGSPSISPAVSIDDSLLVGLNVGLGADSSTSSSDAVVIARNSTIVTTKTAGEGAAVFATASGTGHTTITLDGTIAHVVPAADGARSDLSASGTGAKVNAAFSGFVTSSGSSPLPGSGTNVGNEPLLEADYTLRQDSPYVDHGDTIGLKPGETALNGPRVLDGDGDGTATVDIGAFEHAYVTPPPVADPGPPPGPVPAPAADTVAPALSKVSVKKSRLTFRLSEKAKVTVKLQRRKGSKWSLVRTLKLTGKTGANSLKLKNLKAARFRVLVVATDGSGNRSKTVTRAFRVGRG